MLEKANKMCIIKSHFGTRDRIQVYWYTVEEDGDDFFVNLYHSPSCPANYNRIPIQQIEAVTPSMVTIVGNQAIFTPQYQANIS